MARASDEEVVGVAVTIAVEGVEAILDAAEEHRPKGWTRKRWRGVVVAALMGAVNQHFGSFTFGRGDGRASERDRALAAIADGLASTEAAIRLGVGIKPATE